MAAAADSTTTKPTKESAQQPSPPILYPIKGRLEKKEAKRPTRKEETTLFTPKPPTAKSMNGNPQPPQAGNEANSEATPLATSFTEQHKDCMRISKAFPPPIFKRNTTVVPSRATTTPHNHLQKSLLQRPQSTATLTSKAYSGPASDSEENKSSLPSPGETRA